MLAVGQGRHLRRRRSVLGRGRGRADAGLHPHQPHRPRRPAAHRAAQAKAGKGSNQLYGSRDEQKSKANAKAVGGLAGVFSTVPNTIGQLIFTGVFERFPNLQIPLIETGVGWIPHLLEQMDDRYWRNRSWGNIPMSEPPSFYWYRNLSATYITDRNGIANRHASASTT